MNREDVTMLGFEIVAFAGEARSKLITALDKAEEGDFEEADRLVEEAQTALNEAHNRQTSMLAQEAGGEDVPVVLTMVHGQDHLMTAELLKDVIKHLINIYKK